MITTLHAERQPPEVVQHLHQEHGESSDFIIPRAAVEQRIVALLKGGARYTHGPVLIRQSRSRRHNRRKPRQHNWADQAYPELLRGQFGCVGVVARFKVSTGSRIKGQVPYLRGFDQRLQGPYASTIERARGDWGPVRQPRRAGPRHPQQGRRREIRRQRHRAYRYWRGWPILAPAPPDRLARRDFVG